MIFRISFWGDFQVNQPFIFGEVNFGDDIVDGRNPANHGVKNPANNGPNYQPQTGGFLPSTVSSEEVPLFHATKLRRSGFGAIVCHLENESPVEQGETNNGKSDMG